MLRTIFSGHTLELTDIVAIGPIMQERKGVAGSIYKRVLTLSLHLKHGVLIRHEELTQQIVYEPQEEETKEWKMAHQELKAHREQLIGDWEEALQQSRETVFRLSERVIAGGIKSESIL